MSAAFSAFWTASVLPPNSTPWELAVEGACSYIVSLDPVHLIGDSRSPQDCPAALLPYLAIERAVDEWDSGWTDAQQRGVVAASFEYHRHQGTRHALDLALAPLGFTLTTREWFELTPAGDPYTFTISVALDAEQPWFVADCRRVTRIANRAKNAHTKLLAIEVSRSMATGIFAGGAVGRARSLMVKQPPPGVLALPDTRIRYAAVASRLYSVLIQPRSIQ